MARIGVIGGGAIGCFYGAQLALAGHEVRLLLRRDYARVARDGLLLRQTATDQVAGTARGEVRLGPRELLPCRTPAEVAAGGLDWALVAVKEPALADAGTLVGPAIAAGARVVVLCNGLDVEERLLGFAPASAIFGMLCVVCVNREADGTIRHLAHGRVEVGQLVDDARAVADLAALIAGAGIRCEARASLREARWRKLGWNIPFNGLSVAADPAGVDTARILAEPAWAREAEALMREVCAIADADLAARGSPRRIDGDALVSELLQRTREMGAYLTSTALDHRAGLPLELDALFRRPLATARRLGVPAPALARLVERLETIARR